MFIELDKCGGFTHWTISSVVDGVGCSVAAVLGLVLRSLLISNAEVTRL